MGLRGAKLSRYGPVGSGAPREKNPKGYKTLGNTSEQHATEGCGSFGPLKKGRGKEGRKKLTAAKRISTNRREIWIDSGSKVGQQESARPPHKF